MNRVDERARAWTLVDTAGPRLSIEARARLNTEIGAGELDVAISSRHRHKLVVMLLRRPMAVSIVTACVIGALAVAPAPRAVAVPGPEIEYTYDVMVRRHYDFPGNDAIGYGFGICDKVSRGQPYASVMSDVKADVFPNDEFAANYVVSNAVGILCPAQIWNLRNSAAGYRPPSE